ncbi:MAG: dicarboxylate/amino acid:cation symporter [Gammaproteobacteria bacterium]|nr:dicarboxylate/amino acid:cation symporter [Gammaproteobacteria bacterium]
MTRESNTAIEVLSPRSLRHLSRYLRNLVEGRLWLKVIIGMLLGLLTGVLIGPSVAWVPPDIGIAIGNWLALPGQLFLATIQMIVIPLVFASIIRGLVSGEDISQLKSLGLATVGYFVITTAVAATIGLTVAELIEPGRAISEAMLITTQDATLNGQTPAAVPAWKDVPGQLIGLLPSNPLSSMVQGEMLQVVIFAAVVGVALLSMQPASAKPLLDLLGSLQEVCMTVVRWAMLLAPIAVFGLMARLTSQLGFSALLGMGLYVATVLLGLLILFLLYLALVAFFGKESPLHFLRSTRELLLLAFSTSSSAAVMPLSIRTAEEKLGVRPSVSQFVIPLGATINMNGTALYQGAATVFLAQVYGIDIGIGGMAMVVAMAVGASIGSPATPGVGIVILAMVLETIGVPASGVALIMGVDRILDMSRTAINVSGDIVACKLMDRWIGSSMTAQEELDEQRAQHAERLRSGEDVLQTPD